MWVKKRTIVGRCFGVFKIVIPKYNLNYYEIVFYKILIVNILNIDIGALCGNKNQKIEAVLFRNWLIFM